MAKAYTGVFITGVNARTHTTSMASAIKPVENRIHLISRLRGTSGGDFAGRRVEFVDPDKTRPAELRRRHASHPLITAMLKFPAAAIQSVRCNAKTSTRTIAVNKVPLIAPSTFAR